MGVHRCNCCTGYDKDGDEDSVKESDKDESLYGDCYITQLIGLSRKIVYSIFALYQDTENIRSV